MSWMSKKTGRPKEDGGHQRINISVDEFTLDVLQEADNRSKLIEQSIYVLMNQPKWIKFCEPSESTSNDQYVFKDAATFAWTPNHCSNNAILSIRCHFKHRCEGEGFRFRMTINGKTVLSSNGWLTSINYTNSTIYSDHSSGEEMKILPNQSDYNIKFQFKPRSSLDTAYVKDINIHIEVADGMPTLSP